MMSVLPAGGAGEMMWISWFGYSARAADANATANIATRVKQMRTR